MKKWILRVYIREYIIRNQYDSLKEALNDVLVAESLGYKFSLLYANPQEEFERRGTLICLN